MRALSCLTLGAALTVGTALSAGELGLIIDKQLGKAQTSNLLVFGHKGPYDAVSPTGFGIRAGFSVLDLKVAELGVDLTYHTKAEGDVIVGGINTGQKYGIEYFAAGGKVEWKFLVNLYAGLELRGEKLSLGNESVTYTRPWIKGGVGMSLPIPVLSPFVRLEYAMPTTKDDKTGSSSELLKALAPQHQIALVAGIKF